MAIKGNIDIAAHGRITGWIWDDARPDEPLRVIAMANGNVISSAVASLFRDDLKKAGIGDGSHGFELSVPAITVEANVINILEEQSRLELAGSPLKPMQRESEDLRLVVDVTDLLLFLDKNTRLTGIPRVQVEILKAICQYGLFELDRLELVALSYAARKFETVNKDDLFAFIEKVLKEDNGIKLDGNGLMHIEKHLGFRPFTPDMRYCRKAVFLSLGSAWGIPDFFVQVNQFLERGMRLILLYHDIIPLVRPELAPDEMADIFNLFVRNSFIFCDAILTVSRNCAEDIAEFARERSYECPPISVVGNGATSSLPTEAQSWTPEPYVLVVSTIEARKNHIVLARAWQKLIKKYGEKTPRLVFVGSTGRNIKPLFDFLRETSCLDGHIQILGNVSDARLASLYKGCLFTAYPSLYEGWGLPVTESLTFGKTCLCSNASALTEAGLDYCVYFDPENVDEAAACAEKLIFDSDFRQALEEHIAREYAPPQWREIASAIIAQAKETGKAAHKAKPAIPLGMEVALWLPKPYPEEQKSALKLLSAFSEGYLTDEKLVWDNYCLGSSLVSSGVFYPRTENGWYGDPDGNEFCIRLDASQSIASASLYLLFEVETIPQDIEFYRESYLICTFHVTEKTGFIRLKLNDFANGYEARILIKNTQNEPVIYKSFLILANDDLGMRLTLQEKVFRYKEKSVA